jgi:hypothetical protein
MKVKRQNQEMRKMKNHKSLVKKKNQKMYQMTKMFNLKVTMELLMLPLTQRENVLKDSG